MGTQGVVSIVKNGKPIVKAVCGCNGYNAEKLAEVIKKDNLTTAYQVWQAAKEVGFGCVDCLVVSDRQKHYYNGHEELSLLYWKKFDDPQFNPRWEHGTAAYTLIIEAAPNNSL